MTLAWLAPYTYRQMPTKRNHSRSELMNHPPRSVTSERVGVSIASYMPCCLITLNSKVISERALWPGTAYIGSQCIQGMPPGWQQVAHYSACGLYCSWARFAGYVVPTVPWEMGEMFGICPAFLQLLNKWGPMLNTQICGLRRYSEKAALSGDRWNI